MADRLLGNRYNNAAERSLRGAVSEGRTTGSSARATVAARAASIYSLMESCKLNRIDPQRYLEYVLTRIVDHPINRIDDLLPPNEADRLNQPEQVSQALGPESKR